MERDVRILIADDHEVVRNGLRTVIGAHPGYKVVAEADCGEAALEMARQHSPDIVILDLAMPNGRVDGLPALREFGKEMPAIPVLILTMHARQQLIREIREAGARGYVLKSDAVQDLMAAIDALLAGKSFFSPLCADFIVSGQITAVPGFPPPASGLPLVPALKIYLAGYSRGSGLKIDFHADPQSAVGRKLARALMDAGAGLEDIPEGLSRNLENLEVFSSSHGTRLRAFVPVRRN